MKPRRQPAPAPPPPAQQDAAKPDPVKPPTAEQARFEALLAEIKELVARGVDTASVWLPLKEAAAFASGYHPETIRLWTERGKVRSRRDGAKILVDVPDLIRHVAGLRRK